MKMGRVAAAMIVLVAVVAPAVGQCEPAWSTEFPAGDFDGAVWDLEWFDDGSGPALYAAGAFTVPGHVDAGGFARWDGESWSSVGGGIEGHALALAVYDDGSGPALFAAGDIFAAGGAPVTSRVAKWDGKTWTPLPGDTDRSIFVMEVFDDGTGPRLYVGGNFARAGGVDATRVAQWDGSSWSAVGSGTSGVVRAMAVFDDGAGPALFVGGEFETAGGISVENLAKWTGKAWEPAIAPPFWSISSGIWELAEWDDGAGSALYATGRFEDAPGELGGVARLRDGGWEVLVGSPVGYTPQTVGPIDVDGHLWMGVAARDRVGAWIDGAWRELGAIGGPGTSDTLAMLHVETPSGRRTYLGGRFTLVDGVHVRGIAAWDGDQWSALTPPRGVGGTVAAIAANARRMHVGGQFLSAGDVVAARVVAYEDGAWSPLGPGFTRGTGCHGAAPSVLALLELPSPGGSDLVAAGAIADAGGQPTYGIARWDGAWHPMGEGLPLRGCIDCCPSVFDLAIFDDGTGSALYATGLFSTPGSGIARWSGGGWTGVGGGAIGFPGGGRALAVRDDGTGSALYVAGGKPVSKIARWDGREWSAVGGGLELSVLALEEFEGALVAAGGSAIGEVWQWDGAAWSRLGGQFDDSVRALAVFDDGSGPALYAGGLFSAHDGEMIEGVARWDGARWNDVAGGVAGDVYAMESAPYKGAWSLLIGGSFATVGGQTASGNIARLIGCASACYPDCDADGELTLFDFLCFQDHFAAMTPDADCDGNDVHDFFDFLCFQNLFAAGCP